jgi:hypothetical protein
MRYLAVRVGDSAESDDLAQQANLSTMRLDKAHRTAP